MFRKYEVEPVQYTEEEKKQFQALEEKFIQEYRNMLPTATPQERRDMIIRFVLAQKPDMDDDKVRKAADFISGYGVLEPLFEDDDIEEILVLDAGKPVYVVHREKGKCRTNIQFRRVEDIFKVIEKMKIFSGELTDKPLIDTTLPEGVRVNVTLPPVSFRRPTITIRKFLENQPTIIDLINNDTLNAETAAFLWVCVDGFGIAPQNILISGGIGSGKTTLLNALLMFTHETERVISIEDTLELNLEYVPDWVRMKSTDEIPMKDLVKNSLRQRGDRIIVGEVRGEEAYVLAAAMNLGHNCIGTIHGSSAEDTILRLRSPPMNVPVEMVNVVDNVIVLKRFIEQQKPTRKVVEIKELGNVMGEVVQLGTLYSYDKKEESLTQQNFPANTIDKMSGLTGLDQKKILKEIKTREKVLKFMCDRISGRSEFRQFVRKYYEDRNQIIRTIKNNRKK